MPGLPRYRGSEHSPDPFPLRAWLAEIDIPLYVGYS